MSQDTQDLLHNASTSFSDLGDGKFHVFEKLHPSSIFPALCVCREWNEWVESLWKHYVLKHYPAYANTKPATLSQLEHIKNNKTPEISFPENAFAHLEIFAPSLRSEMWQDITTPNPRLSLLSNEWKRTFLDCSPIPDLSGTWRSIYGSHGEEFIKIEHVGYQVVATKLKGDVNVPATKRTFEMTLLQDSCGLYGIGRIHLADRGYRNPRWGFSTICVKSPREIELCWYGRREMRREIRRGKERK
eukprot:TRINITY_DN4673_c0_g1_i2.p1 TRINITY_DN4673_c0_g1~~TRINITY_DN4673_c0_g1_i2.p1  ORF type:complete len:245 (-),score=40.61 TRINITY_DN4673_c0_g1_i2:316-1050(-)